ncbi:hypothetical protein ECE50_005980 [Chitinophaga sp. Mgbs1]|uniref:WD40 repeat protein n=1 Tax=Chitinophaga solisilvae TaxID=1233460 RepID=A0A9Q5D9K9_9BACT|nr:hypothetical protein [Chitinophaga solisilvae]
MQYFRYGGILICLLVVCCFNTVSDNPFHYPSPLPDTAALRFLPGMVSADSLDFNSAFTRDGNTFYFGRTINRRWQILQCTWEGDRWSKPAPAPFTEPQYSQADPFVTKDGRIFFISTRPRDVQDTSRDYDIWFVRPLGNGKWSAPENVTAVNSDSTEYFVSLADNGNMYFSSYRKGGYGDDDLYVSRLVNGKYTTPENLGPAVNSAAMEHDPCISGDEKLLLFTAVDRPGGYGSADIFYTRRGKDGKWLPAQNAGGRVNTPTYEYCSYLTPDGRYYFFSSEEDVKWISTKGLFE